MRSGADTFTEGLLIKRKLASFAAVEQPLRPIREMASAALLKLGPLLKAKCAADPLGP